MSILYLIPTFLGDNSPSEIFSYQVKALIGRIKHYIVENEKTARKFIKFIDPEVKQSELFFTILDKRTQLSSIEFIGKPLKEGKDVGLLSEAGLPCIADPGNLLVKWAHNNAIKVIPISGPSSIFLALIASGLNGQKFSFQGYLPIDSQERRKAILHLENLSKIESSSQIFMETPYRNLQLFADLIKYLNPNTLLCIATHITLPDEEIKTLKISQWKNKNLNINKKPSIFIIQN